MDYLSGYQRPKTSKENLVDIGGDKFSYTKVPEYFNTHDSITITCKKHGDFDKSQFSFSQSIKRGGNPCKECSRENRRNTTQEFISSAKSKHGNKYNYDKVNYTGILYPVIITCKKHGDFRQIPENHICGSGCPECNESRGERHIERILIENNIKYVRFKTFKDLKNIKNLYFDFYLPDYNICIEYDGIQHSKEFDFFGGYDGFKDLLKRDNIKSEYCLKNNINLIRIDHNYKKYDEIKRYLSKYISII